jgi:hypothetical protein
LPALHQETETSIDLLHFGTTRSLFIVGDEPHGVWTHRFPNDRDDGALPVEESQKRASGEQRGVDLARGVVSFAASEQQDGSGARKQFERIQVVDARRYLAHGVGHTKSLGFRENGPRASGNRLIAGPDEVNRKPAVQPKVSLFQTSQSLEKSAKRLVPEGQKRTDVGNMQLAIRAVEETMRSRTGGDELEIPLLGANGNLDARKRPCARNPFPDIVKSGGRDRGQGIGGANGDRLQRSRQGAGETTLDIRAFRRPGPVVSPYAPTHGS